MNLYNPTAQNQYAYEQSLRNIIEQANSQLQQIHTQPQPTNLTQNFQIAPNTSNSNFKIVKGVEEVKKEFVIADTYFLDSENQYFWIKNNSGDIKTFSLKEVVQKDKKDLLIEELKKEIKQLKGESSNEFIESNGEQLSIDLGEKIAAN